MKVIDTLTNLVAGLGTSRDKRSQTVYGAVTTLTQQDLTAIYRTSWLGKRIINTVAEDMTCKWLTVAFDGVEPKDRLAVERAEKRFQVKPKFTEAIKWARLYGGAGIVIGVGSDNLATPLDVAKVKKGDLKYLQVLDRHRLQFDGSKLVADPASPHFGKPEFYRIAESQMRVHCSRVLRFEGQQLPYQAWVSNGYWGDSELQHVLDTVKDKDATSAGIAAMVFEANVDVVKVKDLHTQLGRPGGVDLLTKRFQLAATMKSYNRMLLLGADEDYEKKSNSFANLDKVTENFMLDVCGAADIPATRLFGRAPAGMSSTGEGDLNNYYDMIAAKQQADVLPQIEWLYEIIARSELGRYPDDFTTTFDSLHKVNPKTAAEIGKLNAERDAIYINAGVITEGVVARTLKEDEVYSGLTDEDVALAEELAQNVQEIDETSPQNGDPEAQPAPGAPGAAVPRGGAVVPGAAVIPGKTPAGPDA